MSDNTSHAAQRSAGTQPTPVTHAGGATETGNAVSTTHVATVLASDSATTACQRINATARPADESAHSAAPDSTHHFEPSLCHPHPSSSGAAASEPGDTGVAHPHITVTDSFSATLDPCFAVTAAGHAIATAADVTTDSDDVTIAHHDVTAAHAHATVSGDAPAALTHTDSLPSSAAAVTRANTHPLDIAAVSAPTLARQHLTTASYASELSGNTSTAATAATTTAASTVLDERQKS